MKSTEPKFSISEVAKAIGVDRSSVGRLTNQGRLGYYRIGGRRIVSQGQLEEFLLLAERKAKIKKPLNFEPIRGKTSQKSLLADLESI